jgi:hypothetical protein
MTLFRRGPLKLAEELYLVVKALYISRVVKYKMRKPLVEYLSSSASQNIHCVSCESTWLLEG